MPNAGPPAPSGGRDGARSRPRATFPALTSLTDGTLTLRALTPEDWPVVLAEHNDPEQLRWGFTDAPIGEDDARRRASVAPAEWREGRAARLVMTDASTGVAEGLVGLHAMGPPGVALVGYGVLPQFRGRGLTTRALLLLAGWVFSETAFARLELGHKVGNVASGRAAERAGFVREGVHRSRLPNADGTRSDEVCWALVRPE